MAASTVWFSMFVLFSVQHVFARDCSNVEKIKNCNDCIKCGGTWCNDDIPIRCSMGSDDWCPSNKEEVRLSPPKSIPADVGDTIEPHHRDRSVRVGTVDRAKFQVPGKIEIEPDITLTFVNSSRADLDYRQFDIKVEKLKYEHEQNDYTVTIAGTPLPGFCPENSAQYEEITFSLEVEMWHQDRPTITYQVPCACACSNNVEMDSPKCNNRGSWSCNSCKCDKGWKGDNCEAKDSSIQTTAAGGGSSGSGGGIQCDRGDISGCMNNDDEICSNNGKCLCGGKCECFTNKEGSQYFDEHCADICKTTSYCDSCLHNPKPGPCHDCYYPLFVRKLNKTLLDEKDEMKRKIWVQCTEKTDGCDIKYAVMRDVSGETQVMILDNCGPLTAGYTGSINVTVPVILGILAVVAAAAAVAGYMLWKNRAPPLPLADPQYKNIGAEDCTGENPLYKPPTSSFKNPTYGKW